MSLPVVITFASPPEGTCPTTFPEAVDLLESLISGEITTSYTPYVLGSSTPAVEDQDKVWIRLDAVGRPMGTYVFYSGAWRRSYTGKVGEIIPFYGNPATFFDGTGKGLTTGDWDGWALCNGLNGTPNLSDKFLVGGHMDNSAGQTGYSSNWRTMVTGTITNIAGAATHTIVQRDLPELSLVIDGFEYNPGGSPHVGAKPIIDPLYSNGSPQSTDELFHYGFDSGLPETQTAVPTVPPFYALAFCLWIGYA